ncbi:MAG: hypothetical protein QJR05_04565 [Thermoanaerobacterium sp.]|nr:hypothetical protein [Thermoanaerobacterium sp.]
MKTEVRALIIIAVLDILLDALRGKEVDADDFESAIIQLGFDVDEFLSLHHAVGIQKLAHEYAKLDLSKDVLERMSDVKI